MIGKRKRLKIYEQYNWKCQICGKTVSLETGPHEAALDHLIPRVHGGNHEESNLSLVCRSCNSRRGDNYGHLRLKNIIKRVNSALSESDLDLIEYEMRFGLIDEKDIEKTITDIQVAADQIKDLLARLLPSREVITCKKPLSE
ncbi:hypothetical protein GJ688_01925 [Heliobacillus mobilis]|uniref:HNH nuclease domain-containing protein n=1 Tax=Heliobacterium mobile TaxID=28064 RepID=A0A6I3SFC7_HELMO|nr:HNH endonuclease signature motif containing protein [Heliobacterium mobile]MTV47740.1 hypothetical protein [Heliobacterium mobile]